MATSNFEIQKEFDMYASAMCDEIYDENGELLDYEFNDYLCEQVEELLRQFNNDLEFFDIELKSGYYSGVQTYVKPIKLCYDSDYDSLEFLDDYDDVNGSDIYNCYGYNKYILKCKILKEINKINNELLPKLKEYTFDRYGIGARFSNGETFYTKY